LKAKEGLGGKEREREGKEERRKEGKEVLRVIVFVFDATKKRKRKNQKANIIFQRKRDRN